MALTVCKTSGCPNLTASGRCPTCAAEHERKRGSRQARGYDRAHDQLRRSWQTRLDVGELITCARCAGPIAPDGTWHLDHNDDRTGYLGPSHAGCNTAAGGKAAHR